MIERSGLCQIKALNLLFSKNNATPILMAPTVDNWVAQVNDSPKCSVLYKHIKLTFTREYYLTKLPYNLRLAMSKIRTCSHSLPIEAGRYAGSYKPRQD